MSCLNFRTDPSRCRPKTVADFEQTGKTWETQHKPNLRSKQRKSPAHRLSALGEYTHTHKDIKTKDSDCHILRLAAPHTPVDGSFFFCLLKVFSVFFSGFQVGAFSRAGCCRPFYRVFFFYRAVCHAGSGPFRILQYPVRDRQI